MLRRLRSLLHELRLGVLSPRYNIGGGYRRIYHYHIRKSAGTSLNASFWGLANLDLKTMGSRSFVVKDGCVFVRHSRRAIEQGHYFFANSHRPAHLLRLPPGTFTVTVVRSPCERVMSLYRHLWWVRHDEAARENEVYWEIVRRQAAWLGSSFHDFLDRIPRPHLTPQLYMFSRNYHVEEAVERAMSCSMILFTEKFGRGIEVLGRELGLPLREKQERRFSGHLQISLSSDEKDRLAEVVRDETVFVDSLKSIQDEKRPSYQM